jgi:hypothetical protein
MSLPPPLRKAPVGGPYLELDFPDRFRIDFLTDQGSWMDWGAFAHDQVERLDDGSYVIVSVGSPFFIRCVADHGEFLVHVAGDGMGELFYYRLAPIRGESPDKDSRS